MGGSVIPGRFPGHRNILTEFAAEGNTGNRYLFLVKNFVPEGRKSSCPEIQNQTAPSGPWGSLAGLFCYFIYTPAAKAGIALESARRVFDG
jgi:hypothetical protein